MKRVKIDEAALNLAMLVKKTQNIKEPIYIEGIKKDEFDESEENAVLISEKNWQSILETLYLHSFSQNNTFIPDELKEIKAVPESSEPFYW
ncbi:MAG: hypothetical protein K5640_09735 [Treponema sp.]|nr:hypothetical protein [Treponema sp.]